ncbi:hypothetical protein FOA52_012563 [Chlamydomonas sp. UWO 241]|nr:hypothetical protein FOA52_012563 [Chlamydomonas sp. UWO 241]
MVLIAENGSTVRGAASVASDTTKLAHSPSLLFSILSEREPEGRKNAVRQSVELARAAVASPPLAPSGCTFSLAEQAAAVDRSAQSTSDAHDAKVVAKLAAMDPETLEEELAKLTPQRILEELLGNLFIHPDRLKNEGTLGEGAYATVFRAQLAPPAGDLQGGPATLVAVKCLKPSVLESNEQLKDFLMEANVMRKMRHRGVVHILGIGAKQLETLDAVRGSMYIVMEALDGGNLKTMVIKQMRGEVYNYADALQWCIDMADAMSYLHEVCKPMIIHRDLKLENILVTSGVLGRRHAKLADFGLHKRGLLDTETGQLLAYEGSMHAGVGGARGSAGVPPPSLGAEGSYYGGSMFLQSYSVHGAGSKMGTDVSIRGSSHPLLSVEEAREEEPSTPNLHGSSEQHGSAQLLSLEPTDALAAAAPVASRIHKSQSALVMATLQEEAPQEVTSGATCAQRSLLYSRPNGLASEQGCSLPEAAGACAAVPHPASESSSQELTKAAGAPSGASAVPSIPNGNGHPSTRNDGATTEPGEKSRMRLTRNMSSLLDSASSSAAAAGGDGASEVGRRGAYHSDGRWAPASLQTLVSKARMLDTLTTSTDPRGSLERSLHVAAAGGGNRSIGGGNRSVSKGDSSRKGVAFAAAATTQSSAALLVHADDSADAARQGGSVHGKLLSLMALTADGSSGGEPYRPTSPSHVSGDGGGNEGAQGSAAGAPLASALDATSPSGPFCARPSGPYCARPSGAFVMRPGPGARKTPKTGAEFVDATQAVGSLMYMAPETYSGHHYNEKVDVFSFAVMAFELLSMRLLSLRSEFMVDPDAVSNYCARRAGGEREEIPREWPAPLRVIIAECWAQDPSQRPSFGAITRRLVALQHAGVAEQFPLRKKPGGGGGDCCVLM